CLYRELRELLGAGSLRHGRHDDTGRAASAHELLLRHTEWLIGASAAPRYAWSKRTARRQGLPDWRYRLHVGLWIQLGSRLCVVRELGMAETRSPCSFF